MDATTNYTAFGYVINRAVLEPGDLPKSRAKRYVVGDWYVVENAYNTALTREEYLSGRYTYSEVALIISGKLAITPVHTMIPVYHTRGYSTIDSEVATGLVKEEVIETMTVFGINPFDNIDKVPVLPDVSVLRWSAGSVIEPPVRFFLADGSFRKGDVEYSTIGAYTLSSSNIEIVSDCLGFIFN